jgi:hypothetical protein
MSETQKPSRRPAAAKKEQPYHWFQGTSVRALYDQLGVAGPDTARLEVRTEGDAMFFRVVDQREGAKPGADGWDDINNSFLCPPRCP